MTALEAAELFDIEMDRAGEPWFTNPEKSHWLTRGLYRLQEITYEASKKKPTMSGAASGFESSEEARRVLQIYLTKSTPQAGAEFDLSLVNNLFRIAEFKGTFPLSCGGSTNNVEFEIRPESLDSEVGKDAFTQPSDFDPYYEECDNKLQVISKNTPSETYIKYLRLPVDVDIDGAPSVDLDVGIGDPFKVIDLARDLALENIESPRLETAKRETLENL